MSDSLKPFAGSIDEGKHYFTCGAGPWVKDITRPFTIHEVRVTAIEKAEGPRDWVWVAYLDDGYTHKFAEDNFRGLFRATRADATRVYLAQMDKRLSEVQREIVELVKRRCEVARMLREEERRG